jgi:TetR/AcrR family transcriptional regulator, lmrAB and yxaGH operons repressor
MAKATSAREDMLQAATHLFRSRGYEGVGVAELLEASGAPRGSLYFHFPGGKEQIGVEVIDRVGAAVAGQFRAAGAISGDLNQFIDTVFKSTAKSAKEGGFCGSCPIGAIAAEVNADGGALGRAVERAFTSWENEIAAAAIARGMNSKSAAEFASAMLAAVEGALLVSKSQRSTAAHINGGKALKALGAVLMAS